MDVPFATSGAINQQHYALVQKVESAKDPGLADEAIIHEIDAMRARFSSPSFTPSSVGDKVCIFVLIIADDLSVSLNVETCFSCSCTAMLR